MTHSKVVKGVWISSQLDLHVFECCWLYCYFCLFRISIDQYFLIWAKCLQIYWKKSIWYIIINKVYCPLLDIIYIACQKYIITHYHLESITAVRWMGLVFHRQFFTYYTLYFIFKLHFQVWTVSYYVHIVKPYKARWYQDKLKRIRLNNSKYKHHNNRKT